MKFLRMPFDRRHRLRAFLLLLILAVFVSFLLIFQTSSFKSVAKVPQFTDQQQNGVDSDSIKFFKRRRLKFGGANNNNKTANDANSDKRVANEFAQNLDALNRKIKQERPKNAVEAGNLSYDQLKSGQFPPFNVDGSDVIVFLHVQKTGGSTFERYLVKQLDVPQPCLCKSGKKKCQCRRPSGRGIWLFSRFSTGWSCGLHADWTELVASGCVDRVLARREHSDDVKRNVSSVPITRRYFLTTFLRDPIARYLSEFRHIRRGATWSASRHLCNNRYPTPDELPPCFDPQLGWNGVLFDEFTGCPWNLANNRQTRMLADLNLIHCYANFTSMTFDLQKKMLESAKANLLKMAFFGLQEDMRRSQYVFERTFNLQFNKLLLNWNHATDPEKFDQWQLEKVEALNRLDVKLYAFAKELFDKRFEELKSADPLFDLNIAT